MYRNYSPMSLLSFDLLNEVGSFCTLKHVYDVVVKKFTFAIWSPDEFLVISSLEL